MPRLAIDSYWRAHPIRADRLARSLAARSGAPSGWTWRLGNVRESGLPTTFRTPPAPYRERAYTKGPGFCCVCGQPVYRFGWHIDLWDIGTNKNASWHCACIVAWQFWNAPSDQAKLLGRMQARCCGQTGSRLWKTAEVDHRVPLFRAWNAPKHAMARITRLLGLTKPPGDQSRRPRRQVRGRGARPTSRPPPNCVIRVVFSCHPRLSPRTGVPAPARPSFRDASKS